MNDSIITLTIPQFESIIANAIANAVQAIKTELAASTVQESEIHGRARIAKVLGCDPKKVTELVKHGVLGRALWKSGTTNGTMTLNVKKGKERFAAFTQMQWTEQQAWGLMTAQQAETEWQRLKM